MTCIVLPKITINYFFCFNVKKQRFILHNECILLFIFAYFIISVDTRSNMCDEVLYEVPDSPSQSDISWPTHGPSAVYTLKGDVTRGYYNSQGLTCDYTDLSETRDSRDYGYQATSNNGILFINIIHYSFLIIKQLCKFVLTKENELM